MPKYIALTIGPIYKTLAFARKTRELWGASYMFSYLMRGIVAELQKIPYKINGEFIMPAVQDIDKVEYIYGAGLYPDRFIIRLNESEDVHVLQNIQRAIDSHLNVFIKNIQGQFEKVKKRFENQPESSEYKRVQKVIDHFSDTFFKNYLQFYWIEKELQDDANPIIEISKYLDTIELQTNFNSVENVHLLSEFLYFVNGSFLFNNAYQKSPTPIRRFKSLPEIAATDFVTDEWTKKFDKVNFLKRFVSY